MSQSTIFVFDSSYPSADVALEIDETKLHVIVSDRHIEPPPGHRSLKLQESSCFKAFRMNVGSLRVALRDVDGGACIVIAVPIVRKNQLLFNVLYALCISRNVVLFDGIDSKSLAESWRLIFGSALRVSGKIIFGGVKAKLKELFSRRFKSYTFEATPEGRLFGMYTSARTFSLPPDRLIQEPDGRSIYGEDTRKWYLPALSNRTQRFTVQTNRHRLSDISLHVEDVGGSAVRFLFKNGAILDYPYLLGRAHTEARYLVSTRAEVKNIERGIDLLHYTSGYYHWLLEGVPRILDLIDDGVDFDRYPLILPPLELFHRQLLEVLGILPDSQVITVCNGDWCHVRDCIFPTAYFPFAAPELEDPSGQPAGTLLRRVRERILERIPKPLSGIRGSSKRLYISRAQAAKRKFTIQTEDTVRSILEARGFQTVYLERLPWADQVLLLSSAEFVVGLHGAGLSNILFAKAKYLVEFQNPLEARSYFALMARELNIRYAYIVGTLNGHSNNFDNITINPRALTELLHRLDIAL